LRRKITPLLVSACECMFRLLRDTFLYSILLNRRHVRHCIPVLFHPIQIYRLEATTTSVWLRASRPGQYTGILVLRQFLKIEQTLSHGYQLSSLLITKHTSILVNSQLTLSVLLVTIITLFIDFIVYLYRVFRLFSLSRSSDNHSLGCLINNLDMVLFFLSAPLSLQTLCLRTCFPVSKAFSLFPGYIVAHRLLRRPHDGGPAKPNVYARRTMWISSFGAIRAEFLMKTTYLPRLTSFGPSFGGRASIIFLFPPHLFTRSFASAVQFTNARRLYFDGAPFRLFYILARLAPLPDAIKLLNNWVRLGQCSLVIATPNGICITVDCKSCLIGNYG